MKARKGRHLSASYPPVALFKGSRIGGEVGYQPLVAVHATVGSRSSLRI